MHERFNQDSEIAIIHWFLFLLFVCHNMYLNFSYIFFINGIFVQACNVFFLFLKEIMSILWVSKYTCIYRYDICVKSYQFFVFFSSSLHITIFEIYLCNHVICIYHISVHLCFHLLIYLCSHWSMFYLHCINLYG